MTNGLVACDTSEHVENLRDRVRLVLERTGWSQRELARQAGLAGSHISLIMTRLGENVRPETLRAIAAAAKVSEAWLITGRGSPDDAPEGGDVAQTTTPATAPVPAAVESPLVHALGVAFDHTRHSVNDLRAVQDALSDGSFQWQRAEGDLVDAARAWLDAAASLRREGHRVTTVAILYRVTIGNAARTKAREPERADSKREASVATESTLPDRDQLDAERSPSVVAPLPAVEESGPSGIRVISPGGSPAVPKTAKR